MATQPLESHEAASEDENTEGQAPQRNYEAEARELGWSPKEEFKGDAAHWVDAETFVRRGDEVMPLLKKQNKALKRELDEFKKQAAKIAEFMSTSEKRAYERAMADIRARQETAVAEGDLTAFRTLSKEADDLNKALPTVAEQTVQPTQTEIQEALLEWNRENPWYESDKRLAAYADAIVNDNIALTKTMKPADFYAFVADKVKDRFPDETKAKPVQREKPINPVEGATARPSKGGKGFNDLPIEAQRQADKFVRMGILKSRDDYVKNYAW